MPATPAQITAALNSLLSNLEADVDGVRGGGGTEAPQAAMANDIESIKAIRDYLIAGKQDMAEHRLAMLPPARADLIRRRIRFAGRD